MILGFRAGVYGVYASHGFFFCFFGGRWLRLVWFDCCDFGRMSLDEKYELVLSVGEECIQKEELRNLLEKKVNPICYDGFEPSGRMHIAQVCYVCCCTHSLDID